MSLDSCPSCGEPSLVSGTLQSTGAVHFRPLETKFLTFRTADVNVRASMCSACGCVALCGDVEKLRRLQNTPSGQEHVPSVDGVGTP